MIRLLLCHTTYVAFHETFWAVVGGTAPVVALAAVVSIGDVFNVRLRIIAMIFEAEDQLDRLMSSAARERIENRLNRLDPPGAPTRLKPSAARERFRRIGKEGSKVADRLMVPFWLHIVNVCAQAGLLCVALLGIALQSNLIPPWLAALGETVGVILLAVLQYVTFTARGFVVLHHGNDQDQDSGDETS